MDTNNKFFSNINHHNKESIEDEEMTLNQVVNEYYDFLSKKILEGHDINYSDLFF